jgi:pimeloyl-ACP methyl ester carboxylesterase/uncharacterized protein YndB with AHSA1/START domain
VTETTPQSGYAPVNGLQMYYEIHGQGDPLLLLHGAFGTIELWGPILPTLAESRQVIAVELQGHGRTADIDRPLTYKQLTADAAAFMRQLGLAQADVFGYSLGGIAALGLAIEHPDLVRKLVIVGANYNNDGLYPESRAVIQSLTPEMFAGSPPEVAYKAVAPDPEAFSALVEKVVALDGAFAGWREDDLEAITAPALLIYGDSDLRPEHAVQLFRLLGGGVSGDIMGLPRSRLAILPATTHVGLVTERADWLLAMTEEFLAAPMPDHAPATPEAAIAATPGTGTRDLVVTRVFAAPIERVWDAWRDPEQVKRWWGPRAFTVPIAEIDFREGGTSLVCMRPPDGPDLCNTWTYREIVPMQRIEFVLGFSDDHGNPLTPAEIGLPAAIPAEVRHVVTFEAVGDSETEMTVAEYGYPSDEIVAISRAGLEEVLDKFADAVAQD